jgi:preflagellin peptidase FlaK
VDALTTFNLTASVVLLSVASFMDLVRREVDDWVWLLLASVTGPLTLFRTLLYFDTGYPLLVLISIAFSSSVAYLLYRFELYGGADAKAIVALSLAYPVHLHDRAVHPIAPIGVLLNALTLSLTIPVALFMFNAYRVLVRREDILSDLAGAPLRVRLAALFLGTRVSFPKRFWAPMVRVEEDGLVRISLSPSFTSYFAEEKRNNGRRELWATPGIPLVVFITMGLVLYIAIGDFLYLILTLGSGAPSLSP